MANRFGLNRSLGSAVGAIAAVAILSSGIILYALRDLDHATEAHRSSETVIQTIEDFRTAMLNQETGLRGYLLTERESSLEPYHWGRPALETAVAKLSSLVRSDGMQGGRLRDAIAAARAWQLDIGETVIREMADSQTYAAAKQIEVTGKGKRYFDTFRAKLAAMQSEEEDAKARQDTVLATAQRNAARALWLGTLLTLLICALVAFGINRLIVQPLTRLAEVMRRLAQRDLDVVVPGARQRNEVGAMARAVEVFKKSLVELDRTSLLRATADTLPAMVGYVDANRRVGFLNGEFAAWFKLNLPTGDVSELSGQRLSDVFADDPFPGAAHELEAALAGTETRTEHRLARRGSGRRDIEAFYRPHLAPDGRVLGVVTLLTDITDRKKMERRLAAQARNLLRSNEELEQFAYVASHDLKAPLRGIENLVTWIEEDLEGILTGDTRINMDLLKTRVRRLESLLDDLLAYSRAGRIDLNAETIDVQQLVRDLAVLVSPPDGFSIEGSPSLPTVMSARAPLTQAIQNLIGNAIKHHDRGSEGHIWVEARDEGAMVQFAVADDGPGIPAQYRDRVFGMFQTLKPRDEVEGSGMGLAIVKKLVDRHGGRIWLDDGPNGRGVCVRFTWPRTPRGTEDGADGEPAAGR